MAESDPPRVKTRYVWPAVFIAYWLALFVATHVPSNVPFVPGGGFDKLAHLLAYGVLAVLATITWRRATGHVTGRHLWWLWCAIALYGAIDELTQIPVGRHASVWDWVADAAGTALALFVFECGSRRALNREQ